ncbi:MAG: sigma-70 family RNA polymerase sigma factor [Planctomycetes bacterium]|jgi:RNA polymerase sigma factor for flagellar operon FliA|nr:sigma-70 family RNA polymerase sigma factor [Planctomycetota bacterium]MBT4028037.1 sigma-70 family RNA polymerase sigma factor [Planctomycetota bacterium]MBT4561073.1 sigma-70 family RNA polymerase sigma factor [Planctomycetota bacterium]MBT5101934.1 sigma-70 family RNA polymerase sigma factor [Planctomycetota bacterium]MBT5119734.1 sigma-70 family RNA polymerase sigma factor [Planctomycetota bacterium]
MKHTYENEILENHIPSAQMVGEANSYELELDQWEPLVWYVVNRIKNRLPISVSEEELYASGMYGLLKAARSYDPSRGAEFKTYAYHKIRGAVLDDLRRADYLPRSFRDEARKSGVDAPAIVGLPCDEDGHESLGATEATQSCETEDLSAATAREIAKLPQKMQQMMTMYYQDGMKMREIADAMHLTESRVSQIHANALSRLRRAMEKLG